MRARLLAASVALIASLGSCDPQPAIPPGTAANLRIVSYVDEVYQFAWSDPVGTRFSEITVHLRPLGVTKTVEPGAESVAVEVPCTEQLLLLVVEATTAGGIPGEPAYLLWSGEHSGSLIEFFDAGGNRTDYNVYRYDPDGREIGFDAYLDTGVVSFVRDRTDFSDAGVFGREIDYTDDTRTSMIGSTTFDLTHHLRLLTLTTFDGTGAVTSRLVTQVGIDGKNDGVTITDASGTVLQLQYAAYRSDGLLKSYTYRDPDGVVLTTEEHEYDDTGRLVRKTNRDGGGTTYQTLEFLYP